MTDATKQPDPQPSPPADPARGGRTLALAVSGWLCEHAGPAPEPKDGTEDLRICDVYAEGWERGWFDAANAVTCCPALHAPPLAADGAGHGERRWIPVTERLPDRFCVLAADKNYRGEWRFDVGYCRESGNVQDKSGAWVKPTHWMPLPPNPDEATVLVTVLAPDAGAAGAAGADELMDVAVEVNGVTGYAKVRRDEQNHVCGLAGYSLVHGDLCPRCDADRNAAEDARRRAKGIADDAAADFAHTIVQMRRKLAADESARAEARALDLGTACVNQALEVEALRHERDGLIVERDDWKQRAQMIGAVFAGLMTSGGIRWMAESVQYDPQRIAAQIFADFRKRLKDLGPYEAASLTQRIEREVRAVMPTEAMARAAGEYLVVMNRDGAALAGGGTTGEGAK